MKLRIGFLQQFSESTARQKMKPYVLQNHAVKEEMNTKKNRCIRE